jgi:hypothetical protein
MPTMTAMTTFSGYSWNWGGTAMPPLSLRSILPQEQGAELLPQRRIEGPRYQKIDKRRDHLIMVTAPFCCRYGGPATGVGAGTVE